ncbi:type I-E CRISPR-associated protein Cas6/Cse3/CasE [uncultured Methanoregula sp.]|uniref:type I-E CRISPR-associated protein Cas6/Cse3/CasE n=1 Tax=uncultured Methanoregula sp. TaxID=1005933 RepID=UPI002AAAD45D|nr:type I-E CRISPR-associated protein Cas6/Cse3/CasE [uncultured Methanoregula sp.]
MLISRVRLRSDAAEKKEFWEHVDSAYHMHSLVWDLFTDGPERKRDFIYRQDAVHGLPAFFCVSDRVPNDRKGIWIVEPKPYAPVVKKDQVFSFVLRANPIRAKRDEEHKQHRHDVVMEAKTHLKEKQDVLPREADIVQEAGFVWLAQKGEANGFSIRDEDIRADGYLQHRFKKAKRNHEIMISTIDFTGLLTVTDPDAFIRALFTGIGPSKGFGCGMMMIKRR